MASDSSPVDTIDFDSVNQSQSKSKKHKAIQFQIFVDEAHGVRNLEIFNRKYISQIVDTFALKYDIRDKGKISKLKKYVKQQYKKVDEEEN